MRSTISASVCRLVKESPKASGKTGAIRVGKVSATEADCAYPWLMDSNGVKTVQPACLRSGDEERYSCDPPYYIDNNGFRQFKPYCI